MNRLLILAPALLLALPAAAQEAPAAGYQNLWCSTAFSVTRTMLPPLPAEELEAARTAGAAATPEQQELLAAEVQIQEIVDGITILHDAASAGYTEAGFTAEQFAAAKAELEIKVTEQVTGAPGAAEFEFEECLFLITSGTPAETPAP